MENLHLMQPNEIIYRCSLCGSGFSGIDGRVRRNQCEDLPTQKHIYQDGDILTRKDGLNNSEVLIKGKIYRRARGERGAFHVLGYRVIEDGMERIRSQIHLEEHYRLQPRLRIIRKDPE